MSTESEEKAEGAEEGASNPTPAYFFFAGLRSRLVVRGDSSLARLRLSIENSLCVRGHRGHKRAPNRGGKTESEIALPPLALFRR